MREFKEYLKGLDKKELGLRINEWRSELEENRKKFFRQSREWSEVREIAIELAKKELKSREE